MYSEKSCFVTSSPSCLQVDYDVRWPIESCSQDYHFVPLRWYFKKYGQEVYLNALPIVILVDTNVFVVVAIKIYIAFLMGPNEKEEEYVSNSKIKMKGIAAILGVDTCQ